MKIKEWEAVRREKTTNDEERWTVFMSEMCGKTHSVLITRLVVCLYVHVVEGKAAKLRWCEMFLVVLISQSIFSFFFSAFHYSHFFYYERVFLFFLCDGKKWLFSTDVSLSN